MSKEAVLAEVLKTTEANVWRRAKGLKLLPRCGRCGGSGRYSFNGDHSICYGCKGAGQQMPKTELEFELVVADAEKAMVDGRFQKYMDFLEASKSVKGALDRVMAAWKATGISAEYDWRKAAAEAGRDRDIADINAKMAAAFDRVQTASGVLYMKGKPDYQEKMIEFAKVLEEALQAIADADKELKEYING